jgi:hypothetical protein
MFNASSNSKRPLNDSPMPAASFSASAACIVPTMPVSGANTPITAQRTSSTSSPFGEQAVIARRVVAAQVVDADLAVEADGGAGHQRFAVMYAGPVDGVAGGKVVGAVEDDVGAGDQRLEFGAGQPFLHRDDVDRRIDRGQRNWADAALAMPTRASV